MIEPFLLERYFARYEFAVEYLLCSSDSESMTVDELFALEAGAGERFGHLRLSYTESAGAPSLRRGIAASYVGIDPNEILVHSGAEEAIYAFVRSMLRSGDHVVVAVPCYQSLTAVALSQGCTVDRWEAREDDGWALRFEELASLVTPQTRAIFVNSPHNPTGFMLEADALRSLTTFAEERGIVLFCDEVYRGLELDVAQPPAACELSATAVSLGVMSKSFGLPGLRIGWLASRDAATLQAVAGYKDYTTICSSAPSEFLAEIALRHRGRLLDRNRELARANRAVLDEFFARRADRFAWVRPKAGPIAFPRLLGTEGAAAFCDRLVRTAGVLLLPSSCYQYGDRHVRIGFGRANLPEALRRLDEFLG